MSAETEFRALLAAASGVTSLVSTRIAQSAVPQGAAFPLVVFATEHKPTKGLDGTVLDDEVTITAQCWAKTATGAAALADAVTAALGTRADVTGSGGSYDPELDADAVNLTIQWWA